MTTLSGVPICTIESGTVAACYTCMEEWPATDADEASRIVSTHGKIVHAPSGWASGVIGGLTREPRPPRRRG
jgi:hypothetical protein